MATFIFKPLQQTQFHLSTFSHCNYSSTLNTFQFFVSFDSPPIKHSLILEANSRIAIAAARSETTTLADELSTNDVHTGRKSIETNHIGEEEPIERRVILKDRHARTGFNSRIRRKEVDRGVSSKSKKLVGNTNRNRISASKVFNKDVNLVDKRKEKEKRIKIPKFDEAEATLRVGLDMCSKRGDVVGAIKLYDLARKEGVEIGQYHYAVLLYLCSSAAVGVVQPAKSGSRSRSLTQNPEEDLVIDRIELMNSDGIRDGVEDLSNFINGSVDNCEQTLDDLVQLMKKNTEYYSNRRNDGSEGHGLIELSKEMKRAALRKGFEIYNQMCLEKVPMNEATFTSVARMAMALGDGDMAFDIVKQMKEYGVNPRLRSYGPALAIFCSNGDVENAFMVEKHMLENGVYPEEPELEALLKVSIEAERSDKVYYVLHKLRTSVRQVSPRTADLIEMWFRSKTASRVGKRKWDRELMIQAMENGGGGWHGKGWLGKGKWTLCRSHIGSDGVCQCCGEKLVTIDLDPAETENFAKSVASIAAQREKKSSFQKFQKWLDYYGPFEAVVDAANVGLYSQRKFKPSKVNAVVNGIRQMLPSRKWPLIVLHNRRISGEKMDEPFNRALVEKWKNADALYATPTGSNDDWYWLYAAIKCRCLIVTNDEMRDHLFQLLGNEFFPKWKERHQVHFSFTETGPTFRMPPPCSVVIQESEKGQWHVPIASPEVENEDERIWLCCSRGNSNQDSLKIQKEAHLSHKKTKTKTKKKKKAETRNQEVEPIWVGRWCKHDNDNDSQESLSSNNHDSILEKLEAAEKHGACVIDFQI